MKLFSKYKAGLGTYVLIFLITLAWTAPQARAQWAWQKMTLKPGWNAVYLHVDAQYATIGDIIASQPGNPIESIWLWEAPQSAAQYVQSPEQPVSSVLWSSWEKDLGPSSALQRLQGNAAYLVKVRDNAGVYEWNLLGKPVPPRYSWTTSGLNLIGFPTPEVNPPNYNNFLSKVPNFQKSAQIFRYVGGEIGPDNPAAIPLLMQRSALVTRGEAVWIRSGTAYNKYFGPVELTLQNTEGLTFGTAGGEFSLRVKNVTTNEITVRLSQLASEQAPPGEPQIAGNVPLLVKGDINTTNLTFGYTVLSLTPKDIVLKPAGQPGSEREVSVGVNRSALAGAPGSLYAGVLRITDSLGFSQIDLPISAEKSSLAGLWVGGAEISSVSQYLKSFAVATNALDFTNKLTQLGLAEGLNGYNYLWQSNSGKILVFGGPENKKGSYLLDPTKEGYAGGVKTDAAKVASPYPMRLIIHDDGASAKLLQKVFVGLGKGTNYILATSQDLLLEKELASARRISSVSFPITPGNSTWNFSGSFSQGGVLATTVGNAFSDQASNPFLHTYHPDHDNLSPLFQDDRMQGDESYTIVREIELTPREPADDFTSLVSGARTLSGIYSETVSLLGREIIEGGIVTATHSRSFNLLGSFQLNRISEISVLTSQP